MKGVVERAVVVEPVQKLKKTRKPDVNYLSLARQILAGQACQERIDTKGFKGKGKFLELRLLVEAVDGLDLEMVALSEASKRVQDATMYLMLHHRSSSGYTFLRWRQMGVKHRHLSWEEAEHASLGLSGVMQEWYGRATTQAWALNEKHAQYRQGIKAARRAIERMVQPVYARPIPQGDDRDG